MTNRDIIFRLSVEKHPQLSRNLTGFADEVTRIYDEIERNAPRLGFGTTQTQVSNDRVSGGTVPNSQQTRSASGPVDDFTRTTQERVRAEREALDEISQARTTREQLEEQVEADRRDAAMAKLRKFTEQRLKIEEELAEAIKKIRAETNQSLPADVETSNRMIEDLRKKSAERLKVVDAGIEDERVRLQRAATKERLATLEREEKAVDAAESKYEAMQNSIRGSKRETVQALAEIGSAIMQTTRGIVALGLAGEEDMEKIVKGLLKVQGAFDIIQGGVNIWVKWQQVMEGARKTILATAAAEEALTAATTARAAAQALGGAAGASAARGAAAGAAGSAVGSAVGGAVGSATTGGVLRYLGGQALGKAAFGATAGTVGLGLGLAADYFSGDGYSRNGFGEFAGTGFIGARALGRADQFLGLGRGKAGAFSGSTFRDLVESDDAVERFAKERTRLQEIYDAEQKQVAAGLPDLQRGFGQRRAQSDRDLAADLSQINSSRFGTDKSKNEESRARLAEEILATEQRISEVREAGAATAGRFETLTKALLEEQLNLEQRKRDLTVERATMARDAAAAELANSEQALRNVEATLETQQRTLMTMQEQFASAKERFGLLNSADQQELLRLFKRGQAGEQLTPEELRKLKQIGSDAADAIIRGQAERRAQAAGVDELFKKELEAIDKITADIARNVSVKADIKWEIEFDRAVLDKQAAELDKLVRESINSQSDQLAKVVKDSMAGLINGVNVRINGLEQRIIDGAGGRN